MDETLKDYEKELDTKLKIKINCLEIKILSLYYYNQSSPKEKGLFQFNLINKTIKRLVNSLADHYLIYAAFTNDEPERYLFSLKAIDINSDIKELKEKVRLPYIINIIKDNQDNNYFYDITLDCIPIKFSEEYLNEFNKYMKRLKFDLKNSGKALIDTTFKVYEMKLDDKIDNDYDFFLKLIHKKYELISKYKK